MDETTDIVVLGAGAAGLAAASRLREQGKRALVLEARERVGGRILTHFPSRTSYPVELGAEFIHGKPRELQPFLGAATQVNAGWWSRKAGRLVSSESAMSHIERILAAMGSAISGTDRSFLDAAARIREDFDVEWIAQAAEFVAGFHGARLEEVSARSLVAAGASTGSEEEEESFRLTTGYESVLAPFLETLSPSQAVRLESPVKRIRWDRNGVEVHTARGLVRAEQAIVTLPVACWPDVAFDPPLPDSKQRALDSIGRGQVQRVTLRFDVPFWERKDFRPGFVQATGEPFPIFWTVRPWEEPRFIAWAGGSQLDRMAGPLVPQAITSLARALGVAEQKVTSHLIDAHTCDWSADPYSKCAYSYLKVGGENAFAELARPVEGILFFAGEATNADGRHGTVDGAIATGIRAATEALGRAV